MHSRWGVIHGDGHRRRRAEIEIRIRGAGDERVRAVSVPTRVPTDFIRSRLISADEGAVFGDPDLGDTVMIRRADAEGDRATERLTLPGRVEDDAGWLGINTGAGHACQVLTPKHHNLTKLYPGHPDGGARRNARRPSRHCETPNAPPAIAQLIGKALGGARRTRAQRLNDPLQVDRAFQGLLDVGRHRVVGAFREGGSQHDGRVHRDGRRENGHTPAHQLLQALGERRSLGAARVGIPVAGDQHVLRELVERGLMGSHHSLDFFSQARRGGKGAGDCQTRGHSPSPRDGRMSSVCSHREQRVCGAPKSIA